MPDVPRRVVLDGRHLRQVLLNLLGNAIKFTAEGRGRGSTSRAPTGDLAFEVSDTGPGIEPEALSEIFEAFTQTEDRRRGRRHRARPDDQPAPAAGHGRRAEVESALGEGSRFYFTLPLVAAPMTTGDDADMPAGSRRSTRGWRRGSRSRRSSSTTAP